MGGKTAKCLFRCSERASMSLALHGEWAPAMPPSLPNTTPELLWHRDGTPWGPSGVGRRPTEMRRLGPAAAAWGNGAPRSPIPTQPGNLREDLQRLRPQGWGSGSGLRSMVARGTRVCAACRGRAIPSPACRPCLQSQAALLPGRLPTNHRRNPWGQGRSRMGDQRGSGWQQGGFGARLWDAGRFRGMPMTSEALCGICALPHPAGSHKSKQHQSKQRKVLFGDTFGTGSQGPHCLPHVPH